MMDSKNDQIYELQDNESYSTLQQEVKKVTTGSNNLTVVKISTAKKSWKCFGVVVAPCHTG